MRPQHRAAATDGGAVRPLPRAAPDRVHHARLRGHVARDPALRHPRPRPRRMPAAAGRAAPHPLEHLRRRPRPRRADRSRHRHRDRRAGSGRAERPLGLHRDELHAHRPHARPHHRLRPVPAAAGVAPDRPGLPAAPAPAGAGARSDAGGAALSRRPAPHRSRRSRPRQQPAAGHEQVRVGAHLPAQRPGSGLRQRPARRRERDPPRRAARQRRVGDHRDPALAERADDRRGHVRELRRRAGERQHDAELRRAGQPHDRPAPFHRRRPRPVRAVSGPCRQRLDAGRRQPAADAERRVRDHRLQRPERRPHRQHRPAGAHPGGLSGRDELGAADLPGLERAQRAHRRHLRHQHADRRSAQL